MNLKTIRGLEKTSVPDGFAGRLLQDAHIARTEIRQGRFQRSMAVITSFAAIVSGFEAYVQHQRGAFANRWMWTPVWLTAPVVASSAASLFSEPAARHVLPLVSLASLVDGIVGFGYHLRGIGRLPGGFKVGQYNIVMGPPLFAPLLVGTVGVLGLMASALRPEDMAAVLRVLRLGDRAPAHLGAGTTGAADLLSQIKSHYARLARDRAPAEIRDVESEVSQGRFQQLMAATSAVFAVLAGGEAYFEHMRGSYNQRVMWTPVWVTPVMFVAGLGAARSPAVARKVLPFTAAMTFLDGVLGFWLHLRGIRRMPGGFGNLAFNVTLGPPLFAPLLFCAVGLLGGIAALLRRRD